MPTPKSEVDATLGRSNGVKATLSGPAALVRPSLSHLAGYVGPGVIIASVTIGSGEPVYASRSGAVFGYGLRWCFLYAGLFEALQVYTAALRRFFETLSDGGQLGLLDR